MAAKKKQSKEARLRKRAASRGYELQKEGKAWYAAIGGTRFGPMQSLEELEEFLPKES
jgi:hypothetical protein